MESVDKLEMSALVKDTDKMCGGQDGFLSTDLRFVPALYWMGCNLWPLLKLLILSTS